MYTIVEIKNLNFVQNLLPELSITEEVLASLRFPAFETQKGFLIKKILFFKRFKESGLCAFRRAYVSQRERRMGSGDFFIPNEQAEGSESIF